MLVAAVVLVGLMAAFRPPPAIGPASRWGPSIPVTNGGLFELAPRPDATALVDEELYLGTLSAVREGARFYEAQHEMFNRNPGRWDTKSPLTYRQPLITYLWVVVGGGALIGMLWALLASVSMVAVFNAASRLVGPWAALLGPAALALVYGLMLRHPPRILYVEMWAPPLAVTAGALCALALESEEAEEKRLWVVSTLGAACGLLALMVRELALLGVVFMVAALFVDAGTRTRRLWLPWVGALGAWVVMYAVHVVQVRAVSQGDPPGPQMPSYLQPGMGFLEACIRWVSTRPEIVPLVVVACLLAAAGPFTLTRPGTRVLVGGLTLGSLVTLFLVGTPGVFPDGSYTGYWGFFFVPVIVAWTSVGLRLLPAARA